MNLKRMGIFVWVLVLLFSCAACGTPSEESPSSEHLGEKSDEETIDLLLKGYQGLNYPAVSYEAEYVFSLSGINVSVRSEVAVKGTDVSSSTETTVGETVVNHSFVYADGILYLNASGTKIKGEAPSAEVQASLDAQLPFVVKDTGLFRKQSLLRSEDGSCLVVLSDPSVDVTEQLNLSTVSSDSESEDSGEESSGPLFTETSDFYVSLSFSASGDLEKMTVGGNVTFVEDGLESQMSMRVVYRILSTDASQISVTVPEDGDSYVSTELDDSSTSSETTEDSETQDS